MHIRSLYDHNGVDKSGVAGGVAALRNPQAYPLQNRSERFIRVLSGGSEPALLGYAEIHPDGSALFNVPANTGFRLEVVNAQLKAVASKDEASAYLQDLSEPVYSVAAGERLEIQPPSGVNPGASAAGAAFTGTHNDIRATAAGQTMAEVISLHNNRIEVISARLQYQDRWSLSNPAPALDYDYRNLNTAAPTDNNCLNDWQPGCSARASYLDHIQPLWETSGRDQQGNSCLSCHGSFNTNGLNLSGDGAGSDSDITSYRELFTPRSFMFLANDFHPVNSSNCRRDAEWPFSSTPGNDCFTCYQRVLMSELGALESGNFFELFRPDQDHNRFLFNPQSDAQRVDHSNMLSIEELRLLSEWLDAGAVRH